MSRASHGAAALADRFYEFSLLGLIWSGYLALVGSGRLDTPTAVLTGAGLVLRALLVAGVVRLEFSGRLITALAIAYLGFYPIDWAFVSRDFLQATVHFVCFLAVVRILTAKTHRDYVTVKVLAFLQLLAAAVLSTKLNFFVFLALFVLFGVATFASGEIRRSAARGKLWMARGGQRRFDLRLATLSLYVAAGILSLTACLFFLLPRTAHAAFERLVPQRYHLPGFSNEVRLGEIGEILQRDTPVMHVRLYDVEGPVHLKWRGAALSQFDGRRWYNPGESGRALPVHGGRVILADDTQRRREGPRLLYQVQLKGIASDALFFAGVPEVLWISSPVVIRTATEAYRLGNRSTEGFRYYASSFLSVEDPWEEAVRFELPARSAYLQLPDLDPRIHRLARELTGGERSDHARCRALERRLRTGYGYTIELPTEEPSDAIAHFLFERRKGHCEYFASAMAVMLRAVGIPSRVVTGFQSGVYNPISGWYIIRASDAHSWVEAWLPDRGWTTFDPTPPDPGARQPSFWTRLNFYFDAAEMFWQDWVVSYDRERQLALAARMESSSRSFGARWLDGLRLAWIDWKSRAADWTIAYGAGAVIAVMVAVAGWLGLPRAWRWWHTRQRVRRVQRGDADISDAALLYRRLLAVLGKRGVQKPPWLTPGEFATLLAPSPTADLVVRFTEAYHEFRYGGRRDAAPRMSELLLQIEGDRDTRLTPEYQYSGAERVSLSPLGRGSGRRPVRTGRLDS